MFASLLSLVGGRQCVRAEVGIDTSYRVEDLEGRQLLSHSVGHVDLPTVDPAPALELPLNKGSKQARGAVANGVIPIQITSLTVQGNRLLANGLIGGQAFQVPIDVTATPADPDEEDACPILNLELGPINLDLLGLVVETSEICLRIEGIPGDGALLGNLLCSVAGLLDGGLDLGDILDGVLGGAAAPGDTLNTNQVNRVLTGLTGILNGALDAITAPSAIQGVSGTAPGRTDILNLAVGPVDLNLLGLDVELDNCDEENPGPVTVDIIAESGPGNLLGNLLGGLAGALDGRGSAVSLLNRIGRIAREIGRLLG